MFDEIVLQDHNQTCSITHVERADSDTTLQPEEVAEREDVETNFVYVPIVSRIFSKVSDAPKPKQEDVVFLR